MQKRSKNPAIYIVALIAIAGGALLGACTPAFPKEQAEKELKEFMLDFVVKQALGGVVSYTRAGGQPWSNAPSDASLLVWAAPVDSMGDGIEYLKSDQPLQVWWLSQNQLTEVTSDKAAAVQDYRQTRIYNYKPPADPSTGGWGWGYYEFGILRLSNGNRQAEIYVGISCGPLCGNGTTYTLKRGDSGEWKIYEEHGVWIS